MLDSLLALPSLILVYIAHLLSSLRRPLILVSVLCILTNPAAAIRKLKIAYLSVLYLLFCNDKRFQIPKDDPAAYFPKEMGGAAAAKLDGATYKSKTVLLIRHGESTWNDTFNPGDRHKLVFLLFFVPNMIYAVVMELYFFVSGKDADSWFFDSALSGKGVKQSEGLRKFLKKEKLRLGSLPNPEEERAVRLLLALEAENGGPAESHVVSSNLRRAISTAAIGLADRFAVTSRRSSSNDPITLLPCLQEISRNPDALSIIPARGVAHPTWCDENIPGVDDFSALVNTSIHGGNKPLSTNGLIRLEEFCRSIFDDGILPKDVVIAAGHSLFFRSFFQCFLPREPKGEEHIGKKKKIVNGGVVMVTLHEVTMTDRKKVYLIDKQSVTVIYGGFGKHTKG
mmetsp:Transcript_22142/g.46588  ORF Transcript_22142/g.46588 Transcript_22142/m.46588 type:complete len:397 (-) Transcript_22142:263-1453(-)|eukprot:CAMPEP_0171342314 /NCGR_PEP_ID=MMETSP0878-20121228/13999_1 /TAXON_ID=67004 /ORGANISM="Thalassiosira weissflogii, Strain CCMP1336" /LENGTH=396 /DNA_ID=CAMNT_0011844943 /DNA_START=168 /DNA_END=1358 /DNA_ORIENTATION=-